MLLLLLLLLQRCHSGPARQRETAARPTLVACVRCSHVPNPFHPYLGYVPARAIVANGHLWNVSRCDVGGWAQGQQAPPPTQAGWLARRHYHGSSGLAAMSRHQSGPCSHQGEPDEPGKASATLHHTIRPPVQVLPQREATRKAPTLKL